MTKRTDRLAGLRDLVAAPAAAAPAKPAAPEKAPPLLPFNMRLPEDVRDRLVILAGRATVAEGKPVTAQEIARRALEGGLHAVEAALIGAGR